MKKNELANLNRDIRNSNRSEPAPAVSVADIKSLHDANKQKLGVKIAGLKTKVAGLRARTVAAKTRLTAIG